MGRVAIQVLEPEKQKCEALVMKAIDAVIGLPIIIDVQKVQDMDKIKKYDVAETPGLVVNGKVKVFGRVPKKEEIKKWVKEETKIA